MKKLLIIIGLIFAGFVANSQNQSNNICSIEKRCGKIINVETKEKISSEDLMLILDEDTYKTYRTGRTLHIVSIPFWCTTAAFASLTTSSFIMAHKTLNAQTNSNSEELGNAIGFSLFYAGGIIMSLGTMVSAIPSIAITVCSNAKMNKVVDNYNNKTNDITLNFGATNSGIGFTLNF